MTTPRRLIDEIEHLSAAEKRALEAARGDRPRAEFVDGVFASLLARIPPLGPGGDGGGSVGSGASGASSGTATTATGGAGAIGGAGATGSAGALGGAFGAAGVAGAIKAAALGATIGALVLSGRAVLVPAPAAPARGASVEVAPSFAADQHLRTAIPENAGALEPSRTRVSPSDPAPTETPTPAPLAAGARPSDAPGIGSESRGQASGRSSREPNVALPSAGGDGPMAASGAAEDPLQETRLVGDAREALRRDDWRTAAALLEQARQRFPRGILLQEREALAIEALVQSGQRALAGERAQAFFRAYPASPHAARVRAVVAAP